MAWKESSKVRQLLEDPQTRKQVLGVMRGNLSITANATGVVRDTAGNMLGRLVDVHMSTVPEPQKK